MRYADLIPSNWLDPLLTGPGAPLRNSGPYTGTDIENLLRALRQRIAAHEEEANARPEGSVRPMPNPPPSMNYLESQAWKLGWYNGAYGRDPWDEERGPQPQAPKEG